MAQLVRNVIGESQSGYVKEKALQQWLKQAWPNMDIPVQVCIPRLWFNVKCLEMAVKQRGNHKLSS